MTSRISPKALVTIALLIMPFTAFSQARKDTRPPEKMPTPEEIRNPPKSWVDPDTGHRVTRLTDEPGSASFYFNVNAYTPNGKEMAYTTTDGVRVLELDTLKTRPVVNERVHTLEVGHKTPSIFYTKEDGSIWKTNMDTGESKQLAQLPLKYHVVTINADETLAAGTVMEEDRGNEEFGRNGGARAKGAGATQTSPLEQAANKGEMMERRLAAKIPLTLFVVSLTGGSKVTPLLQHSTDWINHLLFSPTDPSLLMYCHEGPWQKVDRIWTIHTDGTHNQLMHQRTMPNEIAGHEFWGKDGETIYYDLQTPKGEDFWIASVEPSNMHRRWFHLQRNEWSIHFNVTKEADLFTGDGGDPRQVAKAPDGEWIYLFRPQMTTVGPGALNDPLWPQPGVFHAEKLVNMSKHNYTLEPNVSFTPDRKMIIFRSNMFGPTYVFGVEVEKSK